jgi:hypothetical protein
MPTAITALANVTLGSNATTITFSSISQSYQDLFFVFNLKSTTSAEYVGMRVNGLTSLYGMNMFDGSNTTTNAYSTVNTSTMFHDQNYGNIQPSYFGATYMYVCDYSSTNRHKSTFIKMGNQSIQSINMGRFPNNTAITSIVFNLQNWQYATGSSIALYGISA